MEIFKLLCDSYKTRELKEITFLHKGKQKKGLTALYENGKLWELLIRAKKLDYYKYLYAIWVLYDEYNQNSDFFYYLLLHQDW